MFSFRNGLAGAFALIATTLSAQLLPADENGVRSTLRAIASGQFAYSAACAPGFFAPSFEALARPEPGMKQGFILSSDAPARGAKFLQKWQYRIEMTAPPDSNSPASCNGVPARRSAKTWSATARPMPGFSGKSYRINQDGELSEIQ